MNISHFLLRQTEEVPAQPDTTNNAALYASIWEQTATAFAVVSAGIVLNFLGSGAAAIITITQKSIDLSMFPFIFSLFAVVYGVMTYFQLDEAKLNSELFEGAIFNIYIDSAATLLIAVISICLGFLYIKEPILKKGMSVKDWIQSATLTTWEKVSLLFGSFASIPLAIAAIVLNVMASEKQVELFLSVNQDDLTSIVDG